MNLDLQSQMAYGDREGLADFLLVHRLVHQQVDAVIAQAQRGIMPSATINSSAAEQVWGALMDPDAEISVQDAQVMQDWLQVHANLHQAEYTALNLGYAPDLSQVDFGDEAQFYVWMYAHAAIHDTLDQATGTT